MQLLKEQLLQNYDEKVPVFQETYGFHETKRALDFSSTLVYNLLRK